MFGEAQAVIPNFSSSTTPNPNPNPPHNVELNGLAASQSDVISQTAELTTYEHLVANNMIITKQPEIIQPVHCEVCNVTCNRGEVLEKHKQGKKHLKNLQKQAITPPVASGNLLSELEDKKHKLLQNGASVNTLIQCDICNVICNNQDVYAKHLAGKKHSAKAIIQHASTNGLFNPTSEGNGSSLKPNTLQPVRCELCNISCTSNELLNMHLLGKKHMRKLQESETPPVENPVSIEGKVVNSNEGKSVWCELCGISCDTDDVLKNHMSGKKHLKNLEKSQKPIGPNPASATEPEATPGMIGPMQSSQKEEVMDGSKKRKTIRVASLEDVEKKKQKILLGGGTVDALRTCTVCNVVCNSPAVYISHLAGQKHAAMAAKQAETPSTGHNS